VARSSPPSAPGSGWPPVRQVGTGPSPLLPESSWAGSQGSPGPRPRFQ
jgi:hypothetical protein